MDNSIITKLIKKVNFDVATKFELADTKEYSFVPVDAQSGVFFIAVHNGSKKEKINSLASSKISGRIEFIPLPEDKFEMLYDSFAQKYCEVTGMQYNKFSMSYAARKRNAVQEEDELDLSDTDDINIDDDSFDDISISDDDDSDIASSDSETDDSMSESEDESLYMDDDEEEPASVNDVTANVVDDTSVDEVVTTAPSGKQNSGINQVKAPQTKRLGEILIEENLITEKQLELALAEGKAQGIPLGSVLVKMGYVTIKDLKEALAAQMGYEFVTAEQLQSLPDNAYILPEEFIRFNKVIPLEMKDNKLVVGMVNPNDMKVINEIIYQTGLRPQVKLITHVEFENFVNQYYATDKADTEELLEKIDEEKQDQDEMTLQEAAANEVTDSDGAVSQLANKIVTMAIDKRASDIHIEPLSVGYRVRFRIDGSLIEVLRIPAKTDSAVLSRFKVLSKMNIAEHRRAQDGSFTLKYRNRAQDFRVNTLPVAGKEKMVIRVLAPQMDSKQAKADKIEVVGASEDDIKKIKYLVSSPHGIVLTSGPTGSGKTTTLYALLRYLNSDSVNITTIEDPVEIKLEGINQSSINTKAGITFANSLRAILRQDPDTILIGEIRDYETLEVAISASLTGHLVLSTVHTNSAAATITRLIEMGAKDYLISSTLSGVIAQRLVKRLCPNCKEEYYPTVEEAKKILTDPAEIQQLTKTKLYRPKGCQNCRNTGYLGRLAVLEILVINNEIRKLIAQRAHDVEIEDYAVKQGMKTLKMSCLRHILEGETSIDEQVRILGLASEES